MHPHNPYFFNPLADNHSLEDTPEQIDSTLSDVDKSNQSNDIIMADDEVNVWSPLCNPHPKLMNQFDTSSQKQVNINCSGQRSDMDLCHSSPNVNLNSLDDAKNISNTNPDNGEDIISVQDK